MQTLSETVVRVQREIEADMAEGRVPSTVDNFGDLHSYVDANEYGGLCEPEVIGVFETFDALVDFANEVQDSVDEWLRAGRA